MSGRLIVAVLATGLAVPSLGQIQAPPPGSVSSESVREKAGGEEQPAGDDGEVFRRLGGWPLGPPEVVAVDVPRGLVYLSSGGAVVVLEASDPTAMTVVSDTLWAAGKILDLFYDPLTERLYVAVGTLGMEIWDVAAPEEPIRLGQLQLEQFGLNPPVRGIEVRGDFAYVAADFGVIHRIDVSDPTNPIDVAHVTGFSDVDDVFIAGDYLYSAGNDIGKFRIWPDGSLTFIGDNPNHGRTIFVAGDYGYIPHNGDLLILDVSGSHFPFVSLFAGANIRDVFVVGSVAYAADYASGVHLLDVADPANPVEISFYPHSAVDIQLHAGVAFLPSIYGLRTADFQDPADPQSLGFHDTVSLTYDAEIVDSTAFVANGDGLLVLDVADFERPVLLARKDVIGPCYSVEVVGELVYLTDQPFGLRVFDVSEPAAPVEIGSLALPGLTRGLAVQGGLAYVSDPTLGLRILDVSDPTQPQEVSLWPAPDFLHDFSQAGSHVYAACDEAGLRILDVSDPGDPFEVGAWQPAGLDAVGADVSGGFALVAKWMDGLGIVDVTDPTAPFEVGSLFLTDFSFTSEVSVSGSYAFIDDQTELLAVDWSDPAVPVIAGSIDTLRLMGKMEVVDSVIYLPNGDVGLQIFQFTPDLVFADGFESGDVSAWSATVP